MAVGEGAGGSAVGVGVGAGAARHAARRAVPPPKRSGNAIRLVSLLVVAIATACTSAGYTPTPTARPPTATATTAPAPTRQPTPVPATTTPVPPTPLPTATPRPRPPVSDAINAALANHESNIGVVFHSLTTGETVTVNPDRRFSSASLYKLFVLETAEDAIENGSLDPSEMLTMTAAAAAGDPYFDYLIGTRVSVDCALQTMVQMSGNGAADLLLSRLGVAAINAHIKADGLSNSAITATGAYTSPADVAAVLGSIARGEDVSSDASQRMLDLLSGQQQNDRLPVPLPLEVRVAHKTGELTKLRHDAAIVFAPSGAYALTVLVEDAPTESDARSTIVDVSRAVYDALEPAGLPTYLGLPPRLAQAVFRLPDTDGRLALMGDPRTETASLPSEIERAADAADDLRLRPEVFAELQALQAAAAQNGVAFWVRSAFEQPTDAQAAHALPTAWLFPCPVEQPPRSADRRVSGDPSGPHQTWLGTVVSLTDNATGPPNGNDVDSPVWRWLEQHTPEYGFVPALPEANGATHVAWSLRWVGRDMAQRLAPIDTPDYPARATAAFDGAERELAAQDPHAQQAPPWGLSGACWTIATNSGQGCPSRWYFLGLSLS